MSPAIEKSHIPGFQRGPLFKLPSDREKVTPKENQPESELVKFCEGLFTTGKAYRDQRLGMMDRWRSYRGWYLNSGSNEGYNSRTYVNMIYEKIEKLTADLTEGRPEYLFTPNTPFDVPLVELLNEAVPWVWQSQDLQSQYYHTVKGACTYGTWYWKTIHDPRFGNNGSVIRVNSIAPWYIIPAPYATSMETAPWVIEVSIRTVGELENDYGVKVEPEIGINDFFPQIEEDLKQYQTQGALISVAGDGSGGPTGGPYEAGDMVHGIPDTYLMNTGRSGLVIQKELWIRDGSTIEQYWSEDDGQGIPKIVRGFALKYPRGRVISWANGKLLYDEENPYRDGRFPYSVFRDISVPDFWYGLGEVEHLIDLQLLHDDTHEIIKNIHLFTALGRLIVDESTGLHDEEMGNRPGEIWYTKPGTWDRVNWLQGSAPPAELYTYLATLEKASDLITGSHDVTRGINPTGVTAGRALQTLQSAAGIRIRARLNDLEFGLRQTGRLIGSRVQQFWPTEMEVRVAGNKATAVLQDGRYNEFKNFHISEADREATFNLEVSATSNIDQIKRQEFETLLMLAQLGIPISPETIIETAPIAIKDKILAELPVEAARRMVPEAPEGAQSPTQALMRGQEGSNG